MSLNATELRDARAGVLTIDALEMRLVGASAKPRYCGPGHIRQNVDGSLNYTVYDTDTEASFAWDSIKPPGSWLDDADLFDLEVKDWRGRSWRANRTQPDTSNVLGQRGVVCNGVLREITLVSESYNSTGESIWLFFPVEVRIPHNKVTRVEKDAAGRKSFSFDRNIWDLATDEYTLRISKVEDGLEVEASRSRGLFPEHFDTRLTEALWFVLARPIDWQIRRRTNGAESLTLRRRPPRAVQPRLSGPIEFDESDAAEAASEMFLKYLRHIEDFPEPRFHPTSVNLRQALLASATNIETEALALGVAFESFVRREYKHLGTPDTAVIRAIDAALDFWEQWTGDIDLKRRIRGAVSGFKGSNPRESIKKLVSQAILTAAQRDAWNRIRHTTAHGMDFSADFREVVYWCDLVHTGLLRLMFSKIGYSGSYTDRSVVGWPTVRV